MVIFRGSATALTEGFSLMTLEWRTYIAFQVWESELGIPTYVSRAAARSTRAAKSGDELPS